MRVKCPECGKVHNAPDEYEGRKVRCPGCDKGLLVVNYDKIELSRQKPVEQKKPEVIEPRVEAAYSGASILLAIVGCLMMFGGLIAMVFTFTYTSYGDTVWQQIAAINSNILTSIKCLGFIVLGAVLLFITLISGWLKAVAIEVRRTRTSTDGH